jgi:hypothetical protein
VAEKVEIKIVVDKETGAISVAGAELENFKKKVEETGGAASELTEKFKGLFAGAAISAFFKTAVEESLKEEEALRTLKGAVESNGDSWDKLKGKIGEYAKTQQASTRFDDTETFQVLGRLRLATTSLTQAMSATTLAQNLSVKSGVPLAETVGIINGLLLDQDRATLQATKTFGLYAGGATTAQEALNNLQSASKGAAAAEDSHTKSLNQAKAQLDDFQQQIGDGIMPVIVTLVGWSTKLITVINGIATGWATAGAVAVTALEGMATTAFNVMSMNASGAVNAAVETKNKIKTILSEALSDIENSAKASRKRNEEEEQLQVTQSIQKAKDAAKQKADFNTKLSEEFLQSTTDEFEQRRIKLQEELDIAQQMSVEKITIRRVEGDETVTLEEYKKERLGKIAEDETRKKDEESKKQIEIGKKHEKGMQELEKQRAQNFKSTMEFISTLSSAKNKELAAIGKAAALASAYINTAEAVTKALASAPPPINFALAAAVGAAGAAQVAKIVGVELAQGGVTNTTTSRGIQATIGEGGKREAVLPLENPRAMGMVGKAIGEAGGVGGGEVSKTVNATINITINAFNVEDEAQIRSVARGLADMILQESEEGIRLSRRVVDAAERYPGRAT